MVQIDLKDRKILYELDGNSRQSISKIARKVGLHKNVVNYRIKQLQGIGVISNFHTLINSYKIGYDMFRFYIVYRHITPDIRREIVDYFVENDHTWWVASFEGSYDLCIVLWVKELNDFHIFWEETLKKYRKYFRRQMFFDYVQLHHFRNSFLIDNFKKSDRERTQVTGGGKRADIDKMDFEILKLLAKNSRIATIEISKKLDVSSNTVLTRIRRMEGLDVIQGYRVNIDFTKIGYHLYKVNIDLNDYNQRGRIINYMKHDPHLIMIDKAIGYYDLEFDLWLKDLNHLHEVMDDLTMKFPNDIRNYDYAHDPTLHKLLYIPEE